MSGGFTNFQAALYTENATTCIIKITIYIIKITFFYIIIIINVKSKKGITSEGSSSRNIAYDSRNIHNKIKESEAYVSRLFKYSIGNMAYVSRSN